MIEQNYFLLLSSTYVSTAVRKVYPISVFSVFNCGKKTNGNPIRNRPRPQNHTFVSPMGELIKVIFFIIYLVPCSMTDLSNIFKKNFQSFFLGLERDRTVVPHRKLAKKTIRKPRLHGFQLS